MHRLEYLNHEPILFVDLLCQFSDLFRAREAVNPGEELCPEGHFSMDRLKKHQSLAGVFFNCLVNLNKFIAFETRDLFAIKH